MARIGAHDREGEPLTVATATGSEVIQFFLGDPQGWGAPTFPGGDAGKLRDARAEAGLEVFIHATYGINVASANNRIRIPSRKLLSQQLAAAAAVGATGLIVHGGHVTGGTDEGEGYANWRKAVERIERPIPLLIENTAGGDHAMARGLPTGGLRDPGPGRRHRLAARAPHGLTGPAAVRLSTSRSSAPASTPPAGSSSPAARTRSCSGCRMSLTTSAARITTAASRDSSAAK